MDCLEPVTDVQLAGWTDVTNEVTFERKGRHQQLVHQGNLLGLFVCNGTYASLLDTDVDGRVVIRVLKHG